MAGSRLSTDAATPSGQPSRVCEPIMGIPILHSSGLIRCVTFILLEIILMISGPESLGSLDLRPGP